MKKIIKYLDKLLGVSDLISYYRKLWKARKNHYSMRRAVKIALGRHKADRRRYYVIYDWEGKYHAFNNTEVDFLKRAGILNKSVTIKDLLKEAAIYVDVTNCKSVEQKLKKREI